MSKIATKPATFSTVHSYDTYVTKLLQEDLSLKGRRAYNTRNGEIVKEDGTIYIDYKIYKRVLSLYNVKAGAKLIKGYAIDLLNGLGCLFIARIGRNPNKKKINFRESTRLRTQLVAEGTLTADNWKVYYTDDEYIRLKWFKPSYIRNLIFYTFAPASGQANKSFKSIMSRSISSNQQLKALYPFIPYKSQPNGV